MLLIQITENVQNCARNFEAGSHDDHLTLACVCTQQLLLHQLLTTSTNLKVGLSIKAGCGDVTGAICAIGRQQH